MTLQQELEKIKYAGRFRFSPEAYQTISDSIQNLKDKNIDKDALKPGDRIPSVSIKNSSGQSVMTDDLLQTGPVVISFYRGGW